MLFLLSGFFALKDLTRCYYTRLTLEEGGGLTGRVRARHHCYRYREEREEGANKHAATKESRTSSRRLCYSTFLFAWCSSIILYFYCSSSDTLLSSVSIHAADDEDALTGLLRIHSDFFLFGSFIMAHLKSHFVNSSSGLDAHLPVRPLRKRHPLSDATNWANNRSISPPVHSPTYEPSFCKPSSDPPSILHHSSLHPGGILQNPNIPSSPLSKIEDKRISAVSSEEARASTRLSQISQTSTNASGTNGKGRRKTHVGPWRLGRTIGKGASGRVRKARHAATGQDAAIKIVSKKSAEVLRSQSLAFIDTKADQGRRAIPIGIEREVVIMKMIEHPNIIRLFDIWENRGEL